ncbi:MAG: hypothetical protein HFG89_00720 [Dorea sp.]|jgi:hypothetical protein|nr:hypothetical protein [Dorea sp.]
MIIYRPHRGGLKESLAEAREFETTEQMKAYIYEDWKEFYEKIAHKSAPFEIDDIVIDEKSVDDERCGWHDSRHVCVKRMGKENYMELYGCPQCIGMCAADYENSTH